jgi:hypothetical protein
VRAGKRGAAAHGAQQGRGVIGGELAGQAGRAQMGEQHMQPVDRLGAGPDQVLAVVGQHP